jgi:hypothetical protein
MPKVVQVMVAGFVTGTIGAFFLDKKGLTN